MNAICRSCLCVAFVISCVPAWAAEKPNLKRTEYDEWIRSFGGRVFTNVSDQPKLFITAIEDDEPPANGQEMLFRRERTHGCWVAADGRVTSFYTDPMGSKAGGYPAIPDTDQKRLDKLLLKLPDDGGHLPPFNRRVVLQVPEGDHSRARVYDRANAPDEVLEVLHLSRSGVGSWVPEFKSESDILIDGSGYGVLALTPSGQLVSANAGWLTFWDPATHKKVGATPVPGPIIPTQLAFNADGSLAVICDTACVGTCIVDTKIWKTLRELKEEVPGVGWHLLSFPWFSPDGRHLFLQYHPLGQLKVESELRVYDTKTWERIDKLPGLPGGIIGYFEAPKSKRAVVLLKDRVLALWNADQHREYAKLDEDVLVHQVAFSPDESMVALATVHKREGTNWAIHRIRVWKMDTGELVHELRPFEQDTCETVVGLQWTADGQYILAATQYQGSDINAWNVQSGRHRGNLSGGLSNLMGVVMVSGGRHIAAAGGTSTKGLVIRFWDLAAALKQIRAFEDSLAEPKVGK